MGKRSDFEKVEKDYYPTPYEAVLPLVPFLPEGFTFTEPCAGDGRLIRHIERATGGVCTLACDIDPKGQGIVQKSAMFLNERDVVSDLIITNPPWSRDKKSGFILHRMIEHFTQLAPTWLLFDSDWMQTVQAAPFMNTLLCGVSIGRVKWIEDSKMSGKDNCQWYLFHKNARDITPAPVFFGRGQVPFEGFIEAYVPQNEVAAAA